ncbi:efflux RND transporter periplasmic adaptor subunit [Telmatospirillum siberiense]|uniref:Uncharacterized protein n=1 Tax=Telmatospirillum siberiense TaxID=382514 RepID=A0A2N3Q139_9PROT|nr:efflux RND transporter periplasmic adaptor subunit [Telmatospirillum siberiense]PKU26375.1 hypothetical protein CWS72_00545 [Telmatospirillum siberiense]
MTVKTTGTYLAVAFFSGFLASSPVIAVETPEAAEIHLNDDQLRLIELQTVPATRGNFVDELTINGEITPDLDRTADIQPRTGGVVREVLGRLGEPVHSGADLAIIESGQTTEAEAAYLAARSRFSMARTQLDREEILWAKKISAEQDYQKAKQEATLAEIELRTAERKLRLLGLDPAAKDYKRTSPAGVLRLPVKAPFDGVLIDKRVAVGDQVTEASALYRLANLDKVWVIGSIHENDMGRVAVGMSAKVKIAAYAGRSFEGRVAWVADLLDEKTRTLKIRIELDNKEKLLKPGSFAQVVLTSAGKETLIVPNSAVQRQKAERIVFVETSKGVFLRREVKVGASSRLSAEIIDGLSDGERVVSNGAFALKSELEKSAFADKD